MISRETQDRIAEIAHRAIRSKIFPGCVVGVTDTTGEMCVYPFGAQTYHNDALPVDCNTIYDVASITKAIPVSMLALQALEEGALRVNDPVSRFVPELGGPYREKISIHHLLTHTLDHGFRLSSLKDLPPSRILATILSGNLRNAPGAAFFYSNATSIILGIAVERCLGANLGELARERIFGPLDMHSTGFRPELFVKDRIAPTEIDSWRGGVVQGVVHDESAFRLRSILQPGSAGLFSTAPDLLQVLAALLNNGNLNGFQLLRPETVLLIQKNQLDHIGHSAALGWELNQPRYMGSSHSMVAIGKTGFTGCVIICDFGRAKAIAFLSNYTYPRRKPDAAQINAIRAALADVVFG